MGLAGVSGPFRGAYNTFCFATGSVQQAAGAGAVQRNIWTYTLPAGMDIEIVDIQTYCASVSTATRINVLAGGASILETTGGGEQVSGTLLVSNETAGAGLSNSSTVSKNVFGTTATSITNSVTPSAPGNVVNRGYRYGAYVMGGATLCATMSNLGSPQGIAGQTTCTILWFPRGHPDSLRSSFE